MLAWIDGHPDLADVLFLIAGILFLLGGLARWNTSRPGDQQRGLIVLPGPLLEIGLALVAVGLLVL